MFAWFGQEDQATDSRILFVENGVEISRKEGVAFMTIKKSNHGRTFAMIMLFLVGAIFALSGCGGAGILRGLPQDGIGAEC